MALGLLVAGRCSAYLAWEEPFGLVRVEGLAVRYSVVG